MALDMSIFKPTYSPLLLAPTGLLLWALCLVIYRLFFHPLRHIPGPPAARTSTLYTAYHDLIRHGKLPFAIKRVHEKYGPIIRITPDEVHISDPDFLDTIYAMRNRNAPFAGGLMVQQSVGGAEDWNLHKLRREALNPYFSVKVVGQMEYLVRSKADKLGEILDSALQREEGLNLSDTFFAFANDVVRSFCFGSDNSLLTNLSEAKRQRENMNRLLTGVPVNKHLPWIANIPAKGLPMVLGKKVIPPAVLDMIGFRAKVGQDIEAVLSEKGEKPDHSIFYELRDNTILPPEEKTKTRLQDEATLLILAGTESMAKSLTMAAFYLLDQPETMHKLRKELKAAQTEENELLLATLLRMPYLNAVAQEAHRISLGLTRRLVRYSSTETLAYTSSSGPYKGTSYILHPGTLMSSCSYCIHTDEALFPDPSIFEPERWIPAEQGDSGDSYIHSETVKTAANDTRESLQRMDRSVDAVNRRKRCMLALGKGHRKCIGINLANAEMCLALSVIAQYEVRLFETDESDVGFEHDYQVSHPKMGSKGVRVVVERHAD